MFIFEQIILLHLDSTSLQENFTLHRTRLQGFSELFRVFAVKQIQQLDF